MVEETPLIVVKKDGSREEFSREKVLRGLIRACEKRPVSVDQLDMIVSDVEKALRNTARGREPPDRGASDGTAVSGR